MNNVFSLQEVFAGKILQVPDYQRGYSWEQAQWSDLIEDLEFLAPKKDHYTGSLVLHKQDETVRDEGGQKHDVFHIVDGQQRLTTTVLLLDAIRVALQKSHGRLADGIRGSYICFADINGQTAYKLRLNSDCNDYLVRSVLGDTTSPAGPEIASHERLRDARQYFDEYLQQSLNRLGKSATNWLLDLHDKVTQRLKVGQYLVSESTEVGVIFEVMNNRGKPLSELEKVKNYLLYVSSKLDIDEHTLEDEINDAWTEIFQRLMRARLTAADYEDRLLRAHWLLAYDPARRNWEGSKSIKHRFNLKSHHGKHKQLLSDLRAYVRSLKDSVLAFAEIFTPLQTGSFSAYPENRREELRYWGAKLPRTGVLSAFLPVLMAIRLRWPADADAYLNALKLFEVFAFRVYRWAGRRADAGQTRLFRLGYDLHHEATTLDALSREVRQMALAYCPDKSFEEGFIPADDNTFYLWSGIRYLLYEYEEHLAHGRGVKMTWEQLEESDPQKTIEHILPQQPKHSYWTDRFDRSQRKKLTHHLGNLMLTFDNSVYGNKPYPEKRGDLKWPKPCYASSNIFMERRVAKDFDDWTEDALIRRGEQLRDWALERWRVDSTGLAPLEESKLLEEDLGTEPA